MLDHLAALDSLIGLVFLATIAFGDALIGTSFFVIGEVAFLAAGAAFSASGLVLPAITVLLFAWAGDLTSFYLGRRFGPRASLRFLTKQKRRSAWRKVKAALDQRGPWFVVLSRLLGPVAWVTPFLSGVAGLPAGTFAAASALGVVLGVGQFLIVGAVGQQLLQLTLPFVTSHFITIALFTTMLVTAVFIWRRSSRPAWRRITTILTVVGTLFLTSNFAYFFVLNSHAIPSTPRLQISDICQTAEEQFLVHPGHSNLHLPQPVNVLLISESTGADLMRDLGWHRNVTYTHDTISFPTFLSLLAQETPPISELYLDDHPADSAFQMPGTIKEREHIRWWHVGDNLHFGALSRTDEIAIKYYGALPVLLHDIDPMVDESRDTLAAQLEESAHFDVVGIAPLALSVDDGSFSDYETDGGVLVLTDRGHALPAELQTCLGIAPRV